MKIAFSETKSFYNQLDSQIVNGRAVIVFRNERPDEKSKLWPRLRKCENWSLVEKELKKVKERKQTPIKGVISGNMTGLLAGGEFFLVGWVATLIAGLLFYGVYKECNVKFKSNKDGDIELEIVSGT